MIKLARKHVTLNSLWSVFYCAIVVIAHVYLTFLCIQKYVHHKDGAVWNSGKAPTEVTAYIGLVTVSIIVLPFFVIASVLKVGNQANDGTKLGRDHALDSNTNTLGGKIHNESARRLWQIFPPFSSVLHMSAAFFILLPEVILTSAEVKHGHRPTDHLWTSELDFLFPEDRAFHSDIVGQSNITVLENASYFVVPPRMVTAGGLFNSQVETTLAFVSLAAALLTFAVRYSSVFWFTNKIFGLIFAGQLLLMSVESLFAVSGSFLLFKVASNSDKYANNVHLVLTGAAVLILFVFAGIILLLSSMAVFVYGGNYFQEKFKLVDSKHNPEAYRQQVMLVQGSCQGYKTHTFAMVSLVSVAVLKGPIIYDLVALYRVTKDGLCLTCVIVAVCYMVSWVVLWTILTLKHQWRFRILDYVPLNKPVFMISNENLIKSGSYHGSSSSVNDQNRRKRPSSLPSDITASESGFGDANSSEDERFEISLPPLPEVPGLVNSRRKGSTHSLDRKSRRTRNQQRVTFHETVKRSTSTDEELYPRRRGRPVNITADVHRNPAAGRPASTGRTTPIELGVVSPREGTGLQTAASESEIVRLVLNNDPYRSMPSETGTISSDRSDASKGDKLLTFKDFTNKNDKSSKSNLKSSNMQTQTVLNNAVVKTNNANPQTTREGETTPSSESPSNNDKLRLFPKTPSRDITVTNQLYPRQLEVIDRKHELSRRDSANYSLTSSQDTASNDSEHVQHQHALCSQPGMGK